MPGKESHVQSQGNSPRVSASGGVPLSAVELPFDESSAVQVLATLSGFGMLDAEQVVAAASVPGIYDSLRNALGLDTDALDALLDEAYASLPPERANLITQPAPRDYGFGVRPPSADALAVAEASAQIVQGEDDTQQLPDTINLISFLSPIRNQGSRGTCVSFTLTAANEYQLRRSGQNVDLSEQHLYYETKLLDGAPNACGTTQAKAVMALRDRGQCRESLWPYNPSPPCNNHGSRGQSVRSDGLNYRLEPFPVPARNVLAYKRELAQQRPVTLSVPVYDSWYRSAESRRSGRITLRLGNEPAVGGHAVCLVGYKDSDEAPGGGYLIVRNSWSTKWAEESPYGAGYGTIPYQYILDDAWEAYSIPVPDLNDHNLNKDLRVEEATGKSVVLAVGSDVKITIEIT
jgi:Papain family cysteine protease